MHTHIHIRKTMNTSISVTKNEQQTAVFETTGPRLRKPDRSKNNLHLPPDAAISNDQLRISLRLSLIMFRCAVFGPFCPNYWFIWIWVKVESSRRKTKLRETKWKSLGKLYLLITWMTGVSAEVRSVLHYSVSQNRTQTEQVNKQRKIYKEIGVSLLRKEIGVFC